MTSTPLAKNVQVNGVSLAFIEQGSGEPVIFVHGAFSDLRAWEPVCGEIAKRYRFIAYTQRYFGTNPWPDDGQNFSVATDADDLISLITLLGAGPVHLVGRSRGGAVAAAAAVKNPSLVRSLALYEPTLLSVFPEESPRKKLARQNWKEITSPAVTAARSGDSPQAVRLFSERVYQLGPGGFDHLPHGTQTMLLDNARTASLLFGPLLPSPVTGDALKALKCPVLIMHGEKTHAYFVLVNEEIHNCLPEARQATFPGLGHDGPSRDPAAFIAIFFQFLSKL